jgi:hypothetical protein
VAAERAQQEDRGPAHFASYARSGARIPEQQKAGMELWMAWSKKAAPSSVMQAESKEALAASMKEHPHFKMPDSSIEIVELMPVPGMS